MAAAQHPGELLSSRAEALKVRLSGACGLCTMLMGSRIARTADRLEGLTSQLAALDPVTARVVMDDFRRINREMGITVLINIHHVELALEYCDRVIGIREGQIVFDGPSGEVDQAVLDSIYGAQDEKD